MSPTRGVALAEPSLGAKEVHAVAQAVRSGWVSGAGPFVDRFERRFARRFGLRYACAVSSGTAALHLALIALGIGPGDDVIVPALTFVATANVVAYAGANVIFADVDPSTWNLAAGDVERRVTRATKMIVPVHLGGLPADMTALRGIARTARASLLEDAAQAIGARHRGRPAGSLGDAAAFSFFANKVITTGEGGLITTANAAIDRRVRSLRSHAKAPGPRYRHTEVGFSYRMSSLQAALGVAQLGRFAELARRRRAVAARYLAALPQLGFVTQAVPAGDEHCYSFFGVLARTNERRKKILDHLSRQRIEARPFFEAIPEQAPHRKRGSFPTTRDLSRRGLFIPCGPSLTAADVDRVIDALANVGP
jgi:perosamine synthetase